ncbi:HAD-IA family hydrolase [Limnoraphis robusta]|jgi:beta-phosphoglucomutase-like phosphatase (HAD superfamily)|uniref:HAD-IA family hydrolase n=1 Tax=Limnoraphis robusta CCNP1315 TaxID=3110306 RepID=A0ABU5TVX5_9CYAN|nr:HAD-IA family hydrolase [Limnoraphis robusta]MCG5057790.1 HAD-IA family hydrolase [Limnoraphis sp. WC205]MEA5519029.1 HAD-IA family hydrolase [Limnoraphis robusta CCNP1315]MEA5544121.1 HAD-IA family hydrolase [Limnoraphis robusta CCNP1324]
MKTFPKITHLIYDLDGLLLDTEPLHAKVNQMLASRYDKFIDPSLMCKLRGRKSHDSAKLIIEMLEIPLTVEAYLAEKDAIIYQYYANVPPLEGAVELTQHLAAHHIPQAIATSSSSRPYAAKIQSYQQWFSIFQCVIQGDDPELKQGKPAPDIFLLAAQRLGAKPENCLVFEDALAGVTAAKAAGMSVVAVPAADMDKQLYLEADQILNSLSEFQPQQWQLPSFC